MEVEELNIPDATVFLLDFGGDDHFDVLFNETRWKQRISKIYGRGIRQPRLTAWYGEPNCRYVYSGISNDPLPWTDTLIGIRSRVEELLQYQFNSVLLNLYRTGSDSIGFHSDDEGELGKTPVIASLSYGGSRTFQFRHRRKECSPISVELTSKSLLVMMGDTQRNWHHGIEKCRNADPRINLTFRQIMNH